MASITVTSPAGETIEIVPDADWLATTGVGEMSLRQWAGKREILGALWNHGPFVDPNGQSASTDLLKHAQKHYDYRGTHSGAVSQMLKGPVMLPAIDRDTNGKRTRSVRLVALPVKWYKKLDSEWPHLNGHKAPTPTEALAEGREERDLIADRDAAETVAALVLPDPVAHVNNLIGPPDVADEDDYAPAVELEIASSVAMALLTQVVDIISTGTPDAGKMRRLEADLAQASGLLAARLDENGRMRRTIGELGDEVIALKAERDGLRKRLKAAEYNLDRATGTDTQRIVNELVQKELSKIMSAKPASPKGADAS